MAKRKEQKKKARERRVAQKKIAAQKRVQEKTARSEDASVPKTKKLFTPEVLPKREYIATNKRSPFTHRRSGG